MSSSFSLGRCLTRDYARNGKSSLSFKRRCIPSMRYTNETARLQGLSASYQMQGIVQNGGGGRERLPPTRLADNGMKLEIGPLLYTSYSYSDQKFHGQVKENQPELTPAPTPSYAPIRCHRHSHRRTVFPPNSSKPPVIPSLALPLPSAPYIGTVDVASPSKIMIPSPPGLTAPISAQMHQTRNRTVGILGNGP
ncbi:hypothetical protein ARMSODRAFT_450830 [Armillaria solidipes]|uniref:Uncharacterized protein n=1 Tax=Armillaria solidipes TaxID=1076256 RepID=A0A2H3B1I3_9AGAR|nr:hypothetical protein ARMSODRAFT_450830 [Armillaria solidipes]